VIVVFTLAGAIIGGDIALWPWDEPIPFRIPVATGLLTGLLAGVFIAWVVRQVDELG